MKHETYPYIFLSFCTTVLMSLLSAHQCRTRLVRNLVSIKSTTIHGRTAARVVETIWATHQLSWHWRASITTGFVSIVHLLTTSSLLTIFSRTIITSDWKWSNNYGLYSISARAYKENRACNSPRAKTLWVEECYWKTVHAVMSKKIEFCAKYR